MKVLFHFIQFPIFIAKKFLIVLKFLNLCMWFYFFVCVSFQNLSFVPNILVFDGDICTWFGYYPQCWILVSYFYLGNQIFSFSSPPTLLLQNVSFIFENNHPEIHFIWFRYNYSSFRYDYCLPSVSFPITAFSVSQFLYLKWVYTCWVYLVCQSLPFILSM